MKNESDSRVFLYPALKRLMLRFKTAFLVITVCISTSFNSFSQQRSVSGIVTDAATGSPMPGVNIQVKGTTTGTISEINGAYTLNVPGQDAVLAFSFIGYTSKDLVAGNQSVINMALSPELTGLEEVVVIGYGTVQKKDLTGSVSQVQAKTIKDLSVTRVDQALTGKMAGVQVLTTTGEPGEAPTIRVRGIGSISAGSDPLYVVDGYPVDNIQMLNPNDIETIDVLKDASATAIYGSRGANGVILITTKRGKMGKSVISLDVYKGWQKVLKLPEFLTKEEQADYYYYGMRNQNLDAGNNVTGDPLTWGIPMPRTIMDVIDGSNTVNSDAYDLIFRIAPQQSYNLSASGGNETMKYSVSGEYVDQDGIIITNNFKRYSLRVNLDAQLSPKLSMKLNLNAANTSRDDVLHGGGQGDAEGILGAATTWQRWYPLYKDDGSYFSGYGQDATNNVWNPLAQAYEIKRLEEQLRVLGNLNTEYKFSDALRLNLMLGATTSNRHYYSFIPKMDVFANVADGSDERSNSLNWIQETTLNYNKSFGNHNLTGLLGFTTQKQENGSTFVRSRSYPNNLVYTLNAVSNIIFQGNSDESMWSLISYLARLNYNFKSKYYLTASIRTDGSSRFGRDKKYGYFPSAAIAWRVSEEEFMKNIEPINDLKIRGSYGESGNNNIGNYAHIATIEYESYAFGGTAIGGYAPSQFANSLLTWEKQRSMNAGFDLSLLESRISFSADFFKTTNHQLLLNVNVPQVTGFNSSLQNIGEVENKGWEFTFNSRNFVGKFEWSTDFNISTFKNKVVKLGPEGAPIISSNNITQVGQPMGMFYGYTTDGVFQTQADLDSGPIWNPGTSERSRLGDIRFKDLSGPDGVPDGVVNTYDRTIIGSPYPKFYYGITNNFSYRNFTLSINLQGSQGNKILNVNDFLLYTRARYKQLSIVKNYWVDEANPGDGIEPRPNNNPTGGVRQISTRHLDDASYLKINNINFGYALSENIAKKLYMSGLRVYVNATNPVLITKFKYFNPEVSNSSNPLNPGIMNLNYPIAKSITVGINATF